VDVSKLLVSGVESRLGSRLSGFGWVPVGLGDMVMYEARVGDCIRQVSTGASRRASGILMYPSVSVRFPDVSDVAARLLARSHPHAGMLANDLFRLIQRAGVDASVSRWHIAHASALEDVLERIEQDLEQYAKPFYEALGTFDAFFSNYMEYAIPTSPQRFEMAVAAALQGDRGQALQQLALFQTSGSGSLSSADLYLHNFRAEFGYGVYS
jgi:hypothetical protein